MRCKGGSVLKHCLECWHYSPVALLQLHFSILLVWLAQDSVTCTTDVPHSFAQPEDGAADDNNLTVLGN